MLHSGVVPLQADQLVAVHWTHWPALQAGIPAVGQAWVAMLPKSPLQATQALVVRSQTGTAPVQLMVLVAVHATQWSFARQARRAAVLQGRRPTLPRSPVQVLHRRPTQVAPVMAQSPGTLHS